MFGTQKPGRIFPTAAPIYIKEFLAFVTPWIVSGTLTVPFGWAALVHQIPRGIDAPRLRPKWEMHAVPVIIVAGTTKKRGWGLHAPAVLV
jgi:hypothetical protein